MSTSTLIKTEPTTERWQVPDAVEPPSVQKITDALRKVSSTLGMHTAGWIMLAMALLAAFGGWQTGWIELRYLAVFSGLIVGIALLFTIGKPRYAVNLELTQNRVVVGEPASGAITVWNSSNRRTMPSRLDLPIGTGSASFSVKSLGIAKYQREEFEIPTKKRQVVLVGPAKSVQGDPFYLTGRETEWTQVEELFVHPRTVMIPGRHSGFIHDLEGFASRNLTSSDMSFHALREYVPGDDRRQVHWKSSAKLGQLMVRQYEQSLQSRVVVALDLTETSYLGEDDFEDAVSAVGSFVLQCYREDNPVTMMTSSEVFPTLNAMRSLDQLSGVDKAKGRGILDLAEDIKQYDPSVSVVFLVTGAGIPLREVRRACDSFSLDTRVIGVQVDHDQPLSVRTVANISVVRVDDLNELPRAMRKAME